MPQNLPTCIHVVRIGKQQVKATSKTLAKPVINALGLMQTRRANKALLMLVEASTASRDACICWALLQVLAIWKAAECCDSGARSLLTDPTQQAQHHSHSCGSRLK